MKPDKKEESTAPLDGNENINRTVEDMISLLFDLLSATPDNDKNHETGQVIIRAVASLKIEAIQRLHNKPKKSIKGAKR